jgi:hypothetical protein
MNPIDKIKELGSSLTHDGLTSTRLWVTAGFIIALIWARTLLSEKNVELIFWLAVVYIVCNSLTKAITLVGNAAIKVQMIKAATLDGKLDQDEIKAIEQAK